MPKVLIPTPLRKFTDNNAKVDLEGNTVLDLVNNLVEQYPTLENYILDDNDIKPFIKLFKGEDDIDSLNGAQTLVEKDEVISIIPAIAGGHS